MNGKKLAIGVALIIPLVVVSVILGVAFNSGTAQSGDVNAQGATTIEGSAATGAAVGAAVPVEEKVVNCEFNDWLGKDTIEAEGLAKATGRAYRMLPPNTPMTMDYRAERINVELNDKGIVTKVFCG